MNDSTVASCVVVVYRNKYSKNVLQVLLLFLSILQINIVQIQSEGVGR